VLLVAQPSSQKDFSAGKKFAVSQNCFSTSSPLLDQVVKRFCFIASGENLETDKNVADLPDQGP
jgi:hypothetical protein